MLDRLHLRLDGVINIDVPNDEIINRLSQRLVCDACGNIVEMIHEGKGELVCCGAPMKLFKENTVDAAKEKHVPVAVKTEHGLSVKVGDVPHPMENDHYIEWIEVIESDGKAYRKFLKPGEAPEADFCCTSEGAAVREYCNKHGLWKS